MKPQKDTNAFQANTKQGILFCFIFLLLAVCPATVYAETSLNNQEGVLPDGRGYTGIFVVGEPTEIYKLYKAATDSYNRQDYSNAVSAAEEAIMRYEKSKEVARGKAGFNRFSATNEMARLYGIMAEKVFSQDPINYTNTFRYLQAANRFSRSVTNDVLLSACSIRSYAYNDYARLALRYATVSNELEGVYFNLLADTGWTFMLNFPQSVSKAVAQSFVGGNKRLRAVSRTIKGREGRYTRRWYGLGVFKEDSLEIHLEVMKINYEYRDMFEASKKNDTAKCFGHAQNLINIYEGDKAADVKNSPMLSFYAMNAYLVSAQVMFGREEYESALRFFGLAENKGYPSPLVDARKTEIYFCKRENDKALEVFNRYWSLSQDGREEYFSILIEDGYLVWRELNGTNEVKAIAFLKAGLSLTNSVNLPLRVIPIIKNMNVTFVDSTTIFQYAGPNKHRFVSSAGRPLSGGGQPLQPIRKEYLFAGEGDFMIVREGLCQSIFRFVVTNGVHGWIRNEKAISSCDKGIVGSNILWHSNSRNRLLYASFENIISVREAPITTTLLAPLLSVSLSNTALSNQMSEVQLGSSKINMREFIRQTKLKPCFLPFTINESNTVVIFDKEGVPRLAQARQVGWLIKRAQWFDPCSQQPSTILVKDTYGITTDIKEGSVYQSLGLIKTGVFDRVRTWVSEATGIPVKWFNAYPLFWTFVGLLVVYVVQKSLKQVFRALDMALTPRKTFRDITRKFKRSRVYWKVSFRWVMFYSWWKAIAKEWF